MRSQYPTWIPANSARNREQDVAEMSGQAQRIGINSLEQFVGQNLEEIGEFGREALRKNIKALLEKYNERVLEKETDRSLLIDIPENL